MTMDVVFGSLFGLLSEPKLVALMLAAMLTIVKIASRLPATNPNSRSATISVSRPSRLAISAIGSA